MKDSLVTLGNVRQAGGWRRRPRRRGRPDLLALVGDLRRVPAFATLWDRQLIAEHEQSRKTVVHPEVGEIDIDCDVLATQRSDLRLVVFSKLDLLAALGTQTISG